MNLFKMNSFEIEFREPQLDQFYYNEKRVKIFNGRHHGWVEYDKYAKGNKWQVNVDYKNTYYGYMTNAIIGCVKKIREQIAITERKKEEQDKEIKKENTIKSWVESQDGWVFEKNRKYATNRRGYDTGGYTDYFYMKKDNIKADLMEIDGKISIVRFTYNKPITIDNLNKIVGDLQ